MGTQERKTNRSKHSCTNHPPTLLQHFVPHLTIAVQALQIPFAAPVAACSVATAALSEEAFEAEASFSLINKEKNLKRTEKIPRLFLSIF
jgi:hypothetical protein